MKFNLTNNRHQNSCEYDRHLFIKSFIGEKFFQTLPDNKNKKSPMRLIRQVSVTEDEYPLDGELDFTKTVIPYKIINGLDILNENGAGIFMCVNETDGKFRREANVIKIRSIYLDWDNADERLPDFSLEPSMITETSKNKYHCFWFCEGVPVRAFRQLQESLIYRYGSDPAVKDPARAIRVPGWYHNKKKPYMSNICHYTGDRYTFELLTEKFPPVPKKQWSAPEYRKYIDQKSEFKGKYGASKGGRNQHIIKRIGGMIAKRLSLLEIEQEIYKEAASCNPPLGEFDVNNLLRSAKRYLSC